MAFPASQANYVPDASRYYQPSGAIPAVAPLVLILIGSFCVAIASAAFGICSYYNPLDEANFFLTMIYGGVVGVGVQTTARRGKIRSVAFRKLAGFMFTVLGMYLTWVIYVLCASRWNLLLVEPRELFLAMEGLAKDPPLHFFSWQPPPVMMFVLWAAEGLLVIAIGTAVAADMDAPFCETCDTWCELVWREGKEQVTAELNLIGIRGIEEVELRQALEAGRYHILPQCAVSPDELIPDDDDVEESESPGPPLIGISAFRCRTCRDANYLKLTSFSDFDIEENEEEAARDHRGVPQEEPPNWPAFLVVSEAEIALVLEIAETLDATSDASQFDDWDRFPDGIITPDENTH